MPVSPEQINIVPDRLPILSIEASVDDILLGMYQYVTVGPDALVEAIKHLFSASTSHVQTRSQNISNKNINNKSINNNSADHSTESQLSLQNTSQRSGSFEINTQYASLDFYDDHNLQLSLLLNYEDAEQCKQHIHTSKAQALSHHIQHALAMSHELATQKQDLHSTQYVIDHYPLPLCIIDNNLNTIFTNQAMKKHFATNHTIKESMASSVIEIQTVAREYFDLIKVCHNEKDRITLRQALKELASSNCADSRYFKIQLNDDEAPLVLTTAGYVPNLFRHYARDNLVWVHALNVDYANALKESKGFRSLALSKTEQELCTQLFEGSSLNDISVQRNVSKQTVRKQLQSILRKTECDSQENLVKFLFHECLQFGLI